MKDSWSFIMTHFKNDSAQYRGPTLNEFIDSFSFEVYSEGYFEDCLEDFSGWYSYTMGKNNWRDLDEIVHELNKGNIRVKKP